MWTGGPFKVRVADGRLYGRGSGDMKAGIIAYYMAFRVPPLHARSRLPFFFFFFFFDLWVTLVGRGVGCGA
jgi:hypothetical protein